MSFAETLSEMSPEQWLMVYPDDLEDQIQRAYEQFHSVVIYGELDEDL